MGFLTLWGVKLERLSMTVPIRTCIGCRKREPQTKLIRVVLADQSGTSNQVHVDQTKTALGRGAYLHLDSECIGTAVTRKLLARALKAPGNLDLTEVTELISSK